MLSSYNTESRNGEIYIPLAVAAIPLGIFCLLGLIIKNLIAQGAAPPRHFIIGMVIVQTFGIIATAIVFLMRYDAVTTELRMRTNGTPPLLRKLCLLTSLGCLLVFDVATNVAAVFGTTYLFVGSIPIFILYVLFNRLAFAGLTDSHDCLWSASDAFSDD
ncbi:MAG: hypothetical protein U0930_02845 [Pirellulales bacterium]